MKGTISIYTIQTRQRKSGSKAIQSSAAQRSTAQDREARAGRVGLDRAEKGMTGQPEEPGQKRAKYQGRAGPMALYCYSCFALPWFSLGCSALL
jgi:hypothetical protein